MICSSAYLFPLNIVRFSSDWKPPPATLLHIWRSYELDQKIQNCSLPTLFFFFFSHFKQRNLVFTQVPTLIHQQHSLCFIHTQALLYPKTNFGVSEMKGIPTKLWNATRKQNIADRRRLKLVRDTCRCISIQSVTKKKKRLLESNWWASGSRNPG